MALIIFFELSSKYLRDENDLPRTMSKGILPNRFSLCPPPFPTLLKQTDPNGILMDMNYLLTIDY